MNARESSVEAAVDAAIDWHLRLRDADADGWRSFTLWLEAAPANAAAYARVELDDLLVAPSAAPLADTVAPVAEPARPRRWRRWAAGGGGIAVAAALTAAVFVPRAPAAADRFAIETASGERRTVALGDGTRIELGGGSRLLLDRQNRRYAALDRGEAVFTVRHDGRHPFELRSGGVTLRDLGTVFDVSRDGPRLAVAVAEGAVLFEPAREAVTLRRGAALTLREGSDRILLHHVAAESVGSWRRGLLSFREEPLADVARVVARNGGAPVAVDPALAETPFTGTLRLTGAPARDVARLAALAGVHAAREGAHWRLMPGPDGAG